MTSLIMASSLTEYWQKTLTLDAMHSSNAKGHDLTSHHIMVFIRTICWCQLWCTDFAKLSNVVLPSIAKMLCVPRVDVKVVLSSLTLL